MEQLKIDVPENNRLKNQQSQLEESKQESLNQRGNATIHDYRLIKTIGQGHYSKVKLAEDKRTNQFVAVKIIKRHHVEWLSLPTFQRILNNEVKLLKDICHQNIINLIDWNCEGQIVNNKSGRAVQIFFIVLELVEQGDLFSFIKQKNEEGGFSEEYARYYFAQMLDAIDYLHNQAGVVHRDLKPENLLLSHDYKLKIADFGLSARKDGDQGTGIHYSAVGTRQYQAPEVLEQRSYRGDKVDIFSMGVILFTMVTGAMPYLSEASVEDPLYKLILRRCRNDYWDCWRSIRETNFSNKSNRKNNREELDDLLPEDTSFIEDIMEAVVNCCKNLLSCVQLIFLFLVNLIKFVITLGRDDDLIKPQRIIEPPREKYQYSEEFKEMVFDMMSYNHKQRPTLKEIRNHPWMRMADQDDKEQLRREVMKDMTKHKKTLLEQQQQIPAIATLIANANATSAKVLDNQTYGAKDNRQDQGPRQRSQSPKPKQCPQFSPLEEVLLKQDHQESSSINNWLDDQIKVERTQRNKRMAKRLSDCTSGDGEADQLLTDSSSDLISTDDHQKSGIIGQEGREN